MLYVDKTCVYSTRVFKLWKVSPTFCCHFPLTCLVPPPSSHDLFVSNTTVGLASPFCARIYVFFLQGQIEQEPICFRRFPAKDLINQGFVNVKPEWFLLTEDKVNT